MSYTAPHLLMSAAMVVVVLQGSGFGDQGLGRGGRTAHSVTTYVRCRGDCGDARVRLRGRIDAPLREEASLQRSSGARRPQSRRPAAAAAAAVGRAVPAAPRAPAVPPTCLVAAPACAAPPHSPAAQQHMLPTPLLQLLQQLHTDTTTASRSSAGPSHPTALLLSLDEDILYSTAACQRQLKCQVWLHSLACSLLSSVEGLHGRHQQV